jgi:adenylyl-sulfate kinase
VADLLSTPAPVLWFTGLSGAGKSTIAEGVHRRLLELDEPSEYLDGEMIPGFSSAGFTPGDRDAYVRRVGFLASRLSSHGITAVCALISPYETSRAWVRRLCPRFVEIHVATSLEECERRDMKGLYAAARRGENLQFTGIDAPYEPPRHSELRLDTCRIDVESAVDVVMAVWGEYRHIPLSSVPLLRAVPRVGLTAAGPVSSLSVRKVRLRNGLAAVTTSPLTNRSSAVTPPL